MERPAVPPPGIRRLRLKVAIVLLLAPVAIVVMAVYALQARGVFEATRQFQLVAKDAEGITVGTPLSFAGLPIGSVKRMRLAEEGEVLVEVTVRERDARWLRASSQFRLDRPMVGTARIHVTSPRLEDPPLAAGARVPLGTPDAMEGLPRIMARVEAVLGQVEMLTRADSSLGRSLGNLDTVTTRMAGRGGVLAGLTGDPDASARLLRAIDQLQGLAGSLAAVSKRLDRMVAEADRKVVGKGGTADEAQRAMVQMNAVMTDLRASVARLDAALENARAATADMRTLAGGAKDAGADLATLRAQVDESVRRTDEMLREMNRRWPFARDGKVRLP